MRLLLELGADPLLPNFNNTTPLMAAAGVGTAEPPEEAGEENEALEAVNMLLDLGADINAVNNEGDTAMHGAAHNIYPRSSKLLAKRGADPKIWSKPNKFGRTPLFLAEGLRRRSPPPRSSNDRSRDQADACLAGLSTEGKRPEAIISDAKPVEPARSSFCTISAEARSSSRGRHRNVSKAAFPDAGHNLRRVQRKWGTTRVF